MSDFLWWTLLGLGITAPIWGIGLLILLQKRIIDEQIGRRKRGKLL